MDNKVALITGGSRGLGYSLSKHLLMNRWNVIVDSRNADGMFDKVKAEFGRLGNAVCISGDISDEEHVAQIANAVKSYGHLDLLINNASSLGVTPLPSLFDYPIKSLIEVYRVNVFAPLTIIQSVRPYLKNKSILINITSDAGVESYPNWGGYGSSKAALEHISATLKTENEDLIVYWVDPGDMQTKMKQDSSPEDDISNLPLPEEVVPGFFQLIDGKLPSGRYKAQDLIEN